MSVLGKSEYVSIYTYYLLLVDEIESTTNVELLYFSKKNGEFGNLKIQNEL